MTLMIVDDNQKIRQVIKDLFLISFNNFIECSSGYEAIQKYAELHPDWVLMDIKMKGINGIKAAAEITKENPEAKIIMISNHNDENYKIQSKIAGTITFFLKENLTDIPEFIKNYS